MLKQVFCPNDFEAAYLLIVFNQVHIEGDERSRTNPGHGYPAHNELVPEMYIADSLTQLSGKVESCMDNNIPYVILDIAAKMNAKRSVTITYS